MSAAQFRPLLPDPAAPAATADELAAGLALRDAATEQRPAVVLNMIASLDGRVTVHGRTRPLANRADYEMFHALRTAGDAVLVGAGTVRAEGYGAMEQLAVVVSRSLELPTTRGVLAAPGNRVVVITDGDGTLAPCAADVAYVRQPRIDLPEALRALREEHGVQAIVCEGGPHLNGSLLPHGLVDELHLVVSPLLVAGADPLTLVAGPLLDPPARAELVWLLESEGYLFTRYRLGG